MGIIISSFLSTNSINSILSFVGGRAKYVWGLESNLDALQTEFDKLTQTRDDLLNEVKLAEQKPRTRRTNLVKGWIQEVQQMETKVTELQQIRAQEIDRLCLGGFCSKDLISSYDFGKRVVELKQKVINKKNERGEIKNVAEMVPEDPAVELAVEQTVVGQESILDRVWRHITEKEKNSGIIGLYGTGGVGKTTLLKQVNNNFRTPEPNFHVIIWAVVSREPNLEKIQADIGKRIGLSEKTWQQKSFQEKALDITSILSRKKFVLLLDDIWQPINLTELGVPLQSLNIGSKIIFTTRSLEVCGQMKAATLEVSCLRDDEAWKLFREEVGEVLENDLNILKLAKTIARECRGLPLALKTVGRAMRSRSDLDEWENASQILSTSASRFSGMEEVFWSLKFSYDTLPTDEHRSCLLYCCLFPEDSEILKTDLIDYWISEGFLNDRYKGNTFIGDLVRACLLEGEDDYVKMHDMIREMALWITRKIENEENFLVHARVQLTEPPKIEEWEGVKRISLIANEIRSLTEIPNCPCLLSLLLNDNVIEMITDGFFKFMPSLRVLSLRRNYVEQLPSGISNLVSLHHLDLSCTSIRELPQELKALINLRYLNLERTHLLSRIPQQLISSFSKLQVLRMFKCGPAGVDEGNVLSGGAESLIKELLCLGHLNLISLTLNSSLAVQNFLNCQKLLRITRSLSIRECESLPLNVLHLAHSEHLEKLHIFKSNFEDLTFDSSEEREIQKVLLSGFRRLHKVSIIRCTAKDLTWLAFAPELKKLVMEFFEDTKEIISVEKLSEVSVKVGEHNLFSKLESLRLWSSENLKSIYGNPLPFPRLKKIEVRWCPRLKKLPLNSSSVMGRHIVINGEKEWWEELQWEDEATQNVFSPCFVSR